MNDVEKLFDGWERILEEYATYPYKDGVYIQTIAERGMSWSAPFDDLYEKDDALKAIHYSFGLIETLSGRKAKKLWKMQARRIRRAKQRYNLR